MEKMKKEQMIIRST